MEIGRTTVDRIDPRVRRAGYGFARPFAVDRWDRAPDGSWIALLRSGEFPQHPGQRYMIPPGHMPYHLGLGLYYHSYETAVKEYAKTLQR